jgi:hypothetical protein
MFTCSFFGGQLPTILVSTRSLLIVGWGKRNVDFGDETRLVFLSRLLLFWLRLVLLVMDALKVTLQVRLALENRFAIVNLALKMSFFVSLFVTFQRLVRLESFVALCAEMWLAVEFIDVF